MFNVTYIKLKNGVWGIKSATPLLEGDSVEVHKANGDIVVEVVDKYHSKNIKGMNVYTIKQKYAKGGGTPLPKTASPKKAKKELHYDLFVWEKDPNGDYNPYSGSLYKLTTQMEIGASGIDTIIDFYSLKAGDDDDVVVYARHESTHYETPSSYDRLIGNFDLVSALYAVYGSKKEAAEMVERTWIACKMGCTTFPARGQKIKGIHYASDKLRNVADFSKILSAIVITENTDIENVSHKHYTTNYGDDYKLQGNRRVKLDDVIECMIDKFTRPVPKSPEHGYVDSRRINSKEEALEIIQQCRDKGEAPEYIIMPEIACSYSGVITPDRINLGKGNDGATSGNHTFSIPLEIDEKDKPALAEKFWTCKESYCAVCKTVYEGLLDTECCGQKLEHKWPYVETLYTDKMAMPYSVQLRSGPMLSSTVICPKCRGYFEVKICPDCAVPTRPELVKVKYVKQVESTMDLIEWGDLSKEMKKDIENTYTDEYDRIVPIVWHPGGELSSHFGVHCKETKLVYLTSMDEPVVGSIIEVGLKNPTNLEGIKEGLILGFETPLEREYDPKRVGVKRDLKNFLGSLHLYALADLGDKEVCKFLGYSFAIGCRIISGLPLGEARHMSPLKAKLDAFIGKRKFMKEGYEYEFSFNGGRDIIYNLAWRLDIETIISALIMAYEGFYSYKWSSGYGGPKWGSCTKSLLNGMIAMREFINDPKHENLMGIVDSLNVMINEVHNGSKKGNGTWLDKLLTMQDFDNVSVLPHFYLSPELAFRMREQSLAVGQFAIKLKGYNLAKKLKAIAIAPSEEIAEVVKEDVYAAKVAYNYTAPVPVTPPKSYSQEEIKASIVAGTESIVQCTVNTDLLHIQVRSFVINRPYGYADSYSWKNNGTYATMLQLAIAEFSDAIKSKATVDSLTESKNQYMKITAFKSNIQYKVVFVINENYYLIEDAELYAQMEKISSWQTTRGKQYFV
jgi:hypothetical protein